MIHMIYFVILRIFGEKSKKEENGKFGQNGLLHCSVGNPRCGVDLRRSVGCLVVARPRCQNWHPSGTPWCSKVTPWRRHCS